MFSVKKGDSEVLWNKGYIIVLMVSTCASFSFNMMNSLLTKYLIGLGTGVTIAGIIVGMFSITSLIVRPISGMSADRFNKKKLSAVSITIIGVAVLGYAISSSVPLLTFFRVLHGVAFGVNGTVMAALATDYIPSSRMGEGIGYFGFGQILGSAVAPGIGISVADKVGFNATFVISCIMALLGALLLVVSRIEDRSLITTTEKRKQFEQFKLGNLIAKEALGVTILAVIFTFVNGCVSAFILVLAEEVNVANISLYFTISAVVMFVIRPFAGKIMDKKGLAILLYPAFVCSFIAMIMTARAHFLWVFLLSAVFKSIGQGIAYPSLQAEAVNLTGKDRSGIANSTYLVGADLGNGMGPIIGGVIASFFNYQTIFYTCAILLVIGIVGFFFGKRTVKG